jgi:hypothetical protein
MAGVLREISFAPGRRDAEPKATLFAIKNKHVFFAGRAS